MTKTCVLVYFSQLPRLFRYMRFVKGAPGDLSWQIIVFRQVGEGGVFGRHNNTRKTLFVSEINFSYNSLIQSSSYIFDMSVCWMSETSDRGYSM
jgi:hypothetical protein